MKKQKIEKGWEVHRDHEIRREDNDLWYVFKRGNKVTEQSFFNKETAKDWVNEKIGGK